MADEEKVTEIDFGGALEVLEGRGMIDAGLMGKAEKLETEKLKEEGKEEATADAAATKTPEEIAAEAKAAEEAKKTADEEAAAKAVNADEAIKEPEFTDEQKTFLGKVKDEQDAALKAAKDAADAEKARADAAEQKLAAKGAAQTKIVPLHDLYLVNDEAELRARELQLAEFESWALAHFDGTEAVEASADGKTPAQPAVSAEQIRMAYARVKREREAIVPSAREALRDFQARTESARTVYPELFDSQRSEAQKVQNILKQTPGLRVLFPNIYLVLGDAIRGERARLAEAAAKKAGGQKTAAATTKAVTAAPAPAAQRGAAKAKGGMSAKRMEELGGGREGLVALLAETGV